MLGEKFLLPVLKLQNYCQLKKDCSSLTSKNKSRIQERFKAREPIIVAAREKLNEITGSSAQKKWVGRLFPPLSPQTSAAFIQVWLRLKLLKCLSKEKFIKRGAMCEFCTSRVLMTCFICFALFYLCCSSHGAKFRLLNNIQVFQTPHLA